MPTSGVISKITHLDLLFGGQHLKFVISLKQHKLAQNVCETFVEFGICPRIAKIALLDLDLLFEDQTYHFFITLKRYELAQKCVEDISGF